MCGIAGVLSSNTLSVSSALKSDVLSMMSKIEHRGPDAQGIHESAHGIFGHTRLSIIDLEHGDQPMISEDGRYLLVFNGEIYNYIELRMGLIQQGVKFKTFSDTEVLLNFLIVKGEDALKELNGMFAFCFYDSFTGDWLIARDHFGIKPIYYHLKDDLIYFASEIKALLAVKGIKSEINLPGLNHYFTFQFCLQDETLFNGIKKLEPGHYIKGKGSVVKKTVRYWSLDYSIDKSHTDTYFLEKLEHLLADSLRLQIRSDVALGSYLSGGLDSSLVASLAAGVLDSNIPVFTGKFAEGPEYDESHHAKAVSDNIEGIFNLITPTADDFVEFLPKIIYMLDEPVAGPGVFPQFMVSRAASEHVKVILGGQGGDEIFGGYARYFVGYLEQSLKKSILGCNAEKEFAMPLESIAPNLSLLKQYRPMLARFWKDGLFGEMDERYFALVDRSPDIENIVTPDVLKTFNKSAVLDDFKSVFNRINSDSYVNKMTNFDMHTLLPALLHVEDRMSMAASIESRVPLLDYRIAELMASVPPNMKFQGGKSKALLKQASVSKLPAQVVNRKDKMGFPVPLNEWMKGGKVKEFVLDTLLSKKSLERGIYKKSVLENIASFSGVGARQLWGILSLELWNQTYIDDK